MFLLHVFHSNMITLNVLEYVFLLFQICLPSNKCKFYTLYILLKCEFQRWEVASGKVADTFYREWKTSP